MQQKKHTHQSSGHGFGTAPVFLAAISTILGAILFLRFGFAVGHTGLAGTLLIILIGHAITIPTALAIAEIATNLKVEGGGEYFIISRSFGPMIGGTIGISLYLSQAISVAFYMIAFGEAFSPLLAYVNETYGLALKLWMVSVPATLLLLLVIIRKGAALGVTILWGVVAMLAISLIFFFAGKTDYHATFQPFATIKNPQSFFTVFAIMFPAFTGMTAGVGLSGDLRNPRRSIPLGTLTATIIGMCVYVLVALKLSTSLPLETLAENQFSMGLIAVWGPIIPIGLAAATLSSAIGSILIAPRTMQALAKDKIFPSRKLNTVIARGKGETNEPLTATVLTSIIVIIFVALGSVDMVAQIISMFFMITYGALCAVSFLEHFAGNPSYRPTFKTKWYLSLIGAVACFIMMFQMSPLYAFIAVIAVIVIYVSLTRSRQTAYGVSEMLKGVLFQLTRRLQVMIQRSAGNENSYNWRPSFVAITASSIERLAPFDLLRWISSHYGFGTYIHYVHGVLNEKNLDEAKKKLSQLIRLSTESKAELYVDSIISPSFKTAVAQIIQMPGISGMDNNSLLLDYNSNEPESLHNIVEGCNFADLVHYNIGILRSSERHFGYRKKIHIWLTPGDYRNANLMILLAFIIMGHSEWKKSTIEIFAAFDTEKVEEEVKKLNELIDNGRIPISAKNIQKIPWKKEQDSFEMLVCDHSETADLVILGFSLGKLTKDNGEFLTKFAALRDILFVRAGQKIIISDSEQEGRM